MLLSALVKRVGVFCMQDFYLPNCVKSVVRLGTKSVQKVLDLTFFVINLVGFASLLSLLFVNGQSCDDNQSNVFSWWGQSRNIGKYHRSLLICLPTEIVQSSISKLSVLKYFFFSSLYILISST